MFQARFVQLSYSSRGMCAGAVGPICSRLSVRGVGGAKGALEMELFEFYAAHPGRIRRFTIRL